MSHNFEHTRAMHRGQVREYRAKMNQVALVRVY